MAARELSRTADRDRGALILQIDDGHGVVSSHTIYVLNVSDVDAAIAKIVSDTGAQGDIIAEKLAAALG